MPPRRSPLVLRLFALALADGSGLPFLLHPPPAALESQTPQREPRRLPPQGTEFAKVQTTVKPDGGLPSSVTVQRKSAAPCHLPQGEGYTLRRLGVKLHNPHS